MIPKIQIANILIKVIFSLRSTIFPMTKAEIINPIKYPKLGLRTCISPPVPSANIGNPTRPNNTYISCDIAPTLAPKITPAKIVNKACMVIGTGPIGILMNAPTAVNAANNAVKIIPLVLNLKNLHLRTN